MPKINTKSILNRINTLELFAKEILKETTLLRNELSGVVSGDSPKGKRGFSDSEILKIKYNRRLKRLRK